MTNLTLFNIVAIISIRPDENNINLIESVTHIIQSLAKKWNKVGLKNASLLLIQVFYKCLLLL